TWNKPGDDTTVTTELERSLRSRFSAASKAHQVQPVPARLKPCSDTRPVFSWSSVVEVQLRRS
ncbi:MAG: hypothetical protein ACLQPN_02340, partial [Bryobacteraceae bacterium]